MLTSVHCVYITTKHLKRLKPFTPLTGLTPCHICLSGVESGIPVQSPLDRKDALTKKPLDFDVEEETRKQETSKWLEHHFGSDSRSSNNSLDDEIEVERPPKTSFFNVTIKSQPLVGQRDETIGQQRTYATNNVISNGYHHRVYSPVDTERERLQQNGYFQGPVRYLVAQVDWGQFFRMGVMRNLQIFSF